MSQAQLSWYGLLVGAVLFVSSILVAGGIMSFLGKESHSFQQAALDGEVQFVRPFVERAPKALFGLSFFGGFLIFLGGFDSVLRTMVVGINEPTIEILLLFSFNLGAIAWCLRLSGPEELCFDLASQTYYRVTGWPLFPSSYSGPWQQILGVYVRKIGTSSSNKSYYLVGFLWSGNKGRAVVGSYNAKADAQAEAERIEKLLGMKRVEAPK